MYYSLVWKDVNAKIIYFKMNMKENYMKKNIIYGLFIYSFFRLCKWK